MSTRRKGRVQGLAESMRWFEANRERLLRSYRDQYGLPETLGLPQIGEVAVHEVGDAVRRVPVYAAELKAAGWRGIVEVAGIGGESLLGRDVLNAWIVMLDGPRQTMRVKWD